MSSNQNSGDTSMTTDSKSQTSRGTSRSRGSVIQRAREYNKIIDQNRSRSKSFERNAQRSSQQRSSTGDSQRDRAIASVDQDSSQQKRRYRSSPTPSQRSNHVRSSPAQPKRKEKPKEKEQPSSSSNNNNNKEAAQGQPIVTPELLVDALSGHEDGLLAIAERLMEHYDSGYDVMGEAIIDAFADVQKLFQHVVEAAHMEGAAYEATRKEEEIDRLKRALGGNNVVEEYQPPDVASNNQPLRHEEFIDQDVRDVLVEAIKKGNGLSKEKEFKECFRIYEQACNSASALLPVDSDHRGRLQLSIARAESMSPERACAILRYVMDDVLRSGLNSNSKVVMPDPSQRGDCVLEKPDIGNSSRIAGQGVAAADDAGVLQSSEEVLNSMVEEMKEILSAPVYDNSPLQSVAERFWAALSEAQRSNQKNEEKLEEKLATLKAEFLLAREEWEEKYNLVSHKCNHYKKKIEKMKHADYMEQARVGVSQLGSDYNSDEEYDMISDIRSPSSTLDSPRPSHVSGSSSFVSFSQHAKSLVGSFGCGRKGKNGKDESASSDTSTLMTRKTLSNSSVSNPYSRRS